ncbi:hypothetical protein CR513_18885, partial [Mucuna pruriens]
MGSNVQSNLLPTHRGMAINAIIHENREEVEKPNSREWEKSASRCVTNLANRMEEGSHPSRLDKAESDSIAYIEGNGNLRPKPLIIQYNSASRPRVLAKLVYNNNVVPWRYPTMTMPVGQDDTTPEVTNIAGAGGVMQSGRIFAPKGLRGKDLTLEKKCKATEVPKKVVTKEEATEFLKLIRHSEYEMLDQMNKTPARVSLLSFLINLESHHNLLLKVLEDSHMAQDITSEKFEGIISNITASRHLSFSEDEVPTEGQSHNQPLHITVKCGNYMIARGLIDNGSSLNIMPKATLDKLYGPGATLKISPVVVRAFDGSKQEVMGSHFPYV